MNKNQYIYDKVTLEEIFFSVWGWAMFIIVNSIQIFIAPIILLITFPFDRNRKVIAYLVKIFYQLFYFLNFVQKHFIDYNGIKVPKKGERRIYVLNHASMFDVILMYLLPGPVKSIMKSSYAKIPVIGWIPLLAGNIILEVDPKKENSVGVYLEVVNSLENGSPIVIFPEGSKSRNSKINKFYHGTFMIAKETKSDLIPVVFDTWNVIRPGGLWIRDVKTTIKLLDPVKYEDFKDMEYKDISHIFRIKLTEGLLEVRDHRRKTQKKYYRHAPKYIALDNEMREELKILKSRSS